MFVILFRWQRLKIRSRAGKLFVCLTWCVIYLDNASHSHLGWDHLMLGLRSLVLALLCALVPSLAIAQSRPADPAELVVLFQKQKDPTSIQAAANKVAAVLGEKLGKPVRVIVPGDYAASVQALVSGRADVAYLSSLPFLLAQRDGGARLIAVEQRRDVATGKLRTSYDSVLVVRKDSPLMSEADLRRQAPKLRMAFTSTTSTSGYVFPFAHFVQSGMLRRGQKPETLFAQVSYAGGYAQALTQVVAGRADVAAVSDYTMEGPKADLYLPSAERAQLRILKRLPNVPTHLIAARGGLDPKLAKRIQAALIALSKEQPELLSDVYGAQALVAVDSKRHVAATVAAIKSTGLPVEGLAK
jgi:phosphonate transport system substrate-binding protein